MVLLSCLMNKICRGNNNISLCMYIYTHKHTIYCLEVSRIILCTNCNILPYFQSLMLLILMRNRSRKNISVDVQNITQNVNKR